nr:D-alanyl-D-alanine carboxypeptidase [Thermoleophilaceae bacterium]
MRRAAAIACALWLALAAPAQAQDDASLRRSLATSMRAAGPASGAYVFDASGERVLFAWRAGVPRILASNTKIFTTAAALDRLGPASTLSTRVIGSGSLGEDGTWRGDLYLRGGGDPTFGSGPFVRRAYGTGASVEALAAKLEAAGIAAVRGRVVGDEGRFDALRGGPDSRYAVARDVGPLSALAFDRGLANERGSAFQVNPPAFAAARLDEALERRGIEVRGGPRAGLALAGADELAAVESPALARLAQITNKRSDNFFAETLLKAVGAQDGQPGTTASGARAATAFA